MTAHADAMPAMNSIIVGRTNGPIPRIRASHVLMREKRHAGVNQWAIHKNSRSIAFDGPAH
ncbi:MAG: hypothetical protein CMM26_06620 [Rhodospirillaceae bacterium]|nr:hypothetical protein [Rhodospirillaceae bacterium]